MLLNTCDCQSTFLGLVVGNKYERQEDPAAHIGPRQLTEKSFDGRWAYCERHSCTAAAVELMDRWLHEDGLPVFSTPPPEYFLNITVLFHIERTDV